FSGRGTPTVFADDGSLFSALELDQAVAIASRFLDVPPERIAYGELVTEPDQWTMTQGSQLPMYRLRVDDQAGTEVYVSARLGEVVQLTTRGGRLLSWVSVIPHFLYFQALRMNGDLWNTAMLWGAGLGVVLAAIGIVVGLVVFRPSRPFSLSRIPRYIPYSGALRWHYMTGLVFGVITLAFVF